MFVAIKQLKLRVFDVSFFLLIWLLYICSVINILGNKGCFILLTCILQLYIIIEIWHIRKVQPVGWLINPIVLCSIATFTMSFSISNIIFFIPEKYLHDIGVDSVITPPMNKLMFLVNLSALAMWMGYRSDLASKLYHWKFIQKINKLYFKRNVRLKNISYPMMFFISLIGRLLSIKAGLFGYSSSYEAYIAAASYFQYLNYAMLMGKVGLLVSALEYFSGAREQRIKVWFYILFVNELVFGVLSGFKSAVAMPFLICLICKYMKTNKFDKRFMLFSVVALFAAYTIIEPFRDLRQKDSGFDGTSLAYITDTLIMASLGGTDKSITFTNEEKASIGLLIISRFNLVAVGAVGIDYADNNPILPEDSPKFLQDMLLSPISALVPRFIWGGKSMTNTGLWYTRVPMGRADSISATAMSPVTYLYFAGGYVMVFIGFFMLGMIHKTIFRLTNPLYSVAGGLVFIGVLNNLIFVSSAFNVIFVSMFRDLPIIIILQKYLFNHGKYINKEQI